MTRKRCVAGIDVGKYKSAIAVIHSGGRLLREAMLSTSVENLSTFLNEIDPPPSIIALESGSIGRALCIGLREKGFNAIVIDARHAAPILRAIKRQKTDRNDALAIAHLARIGSYREVWIRSAESRDKLLRLQLRRCLVEIEVTLKNALAAHLAACGHSVKFGARRDYVAAFDKLFQLQSFGQDVLALYRLLRSVSDEIREINRGIEQSVQTSPICSLLMTMPGIGPLTAAWFEAVIDDPKRFRRSRDLGAFVGLIPIVRQSGSVRRLGHITKSGSSELRRNLYLAARAALYSHSSGTDLKRWASRLRDKKGGKIATVALARRMAVVLHAMWIANRSFMSHGVPKACDN